jgi:histidyl-tRNA synthetase
LAKYKLRVIVTNKITRIKGMYDVLPDTIWIWQKLESEVQQLFKAYGFNEIRFPILEKTELFHTTIGEATDVVEKEMYSFISRSGDSLSLRPEGTAGCVRAVIQNNLCNRGQTQKLWYQGPMFRYEQPQKGRNRQFYQIGAEIFGIDSPQADAELILMSARLWHNLGLPNIRLEINSLGTKESRLKYREVLITYFKANLNILDEDSLRRLEGNPLRILDSKNPNMKDLIANAPVLTDYLDQESEIHFNQVLDILKACGINYQINTKLVRGLDYYSRTVFEWITEDLGSQGTICAGGRYDTLVEIQGGKATPAVGFAMGIDRIVELIIDLKLWQRHDKIDLFLIVDNSISLTEITKFSETIRNNIENVNIMTTLNPGSFKSQFKKADKSLADFAVILGENELESDLITIKSLKDHDFGQKQVSFEDLKKLFDENSTKI